MALTLTWLLVLVSSIPCLTLTFAAPPARAVKRAPVPRPLNIKPVQGTIQPLVIKPRSARQNADSLPTTEFVLTQAKDKLILGFVSRDPDLDWNRKAAFVIQLNAEEPLEIEPGIITTTNWPKDSARVSLSFQGGEPSKEYQVTGGASYLVCHRKTGACTKTKSPITAKIKP